MVRFLALLTFASCSHGGRTPQSDDTSPPTSDTGDVEGTCPADVAHLAATLCLESTAADVSAVQGSVTARVLETGPGAGLLGSRPISGFDACTTAERIVRLVDADDVTWTIGWSVDGDVDAASADSITVAEDLTLTWSYTYGAYSSDWSAVLADATGPRFAFDVGPGVSPDLLGGLTVAIGQDECSLADPDGIHTYDESPLDFTAVGSLTLYSGQSGSVELSDRTLQVTVPEAAYQSGCEDGCSIYEWVGWQ